MMKLLFFQNLYLINLHLHAWVNEGEDYLRKHFRWFTKIIANYIKSGYYFIEDFLIDSPWILVVSILFLPCLAAGGLRIRFIFIIYNVFLGCHRYVGRVVTNCWFDGFVSYFMCHFLELFLEPCVLKVINF